MPLTETDTSALPASVGKAASVIPAADFTRGTVVRTLTINEALEQDDRIRTSRGGSIQVRFLDDTLLTIGPDSGRVTDIICMVIRGKSSATAGRLLVPRWRGH